MSPARQKRGGPPKPCRFCGGERVVAWTRPRVDFCYQCLPGGPFTPPPCRGCGSSDYYSQGMCIRCHHYAPQHVDSCRHCLAWGVIRTYKWLCWRCTSWRYRFPRGTCRFCRRENMPVNPEGQCNLCDRQKVITLGETVKEANAHGQQLYLANVAWTPTRHRHGNVRRRYNSRKRRARGPQPPVDFYPLNETQLALFDLPRDLPAAQRKGPFPEPPDPHMAAFLDFQVLDHARRHGWHRSVVIRTRTAMRVLQTLQDTPGAMLLASDAMCLQSIGLPAVNVIDVATAAGVMLDDRQPAIHNWFATTISDLPAPMRAEVTEWFDIMLNGSTTPPRRRPRSESTIRQALRWGMPALTAWAAAGHQSLREITTADVRAVLPPAGNPRSTMGAGLRSIFTVLRARKTLFLNPIGRTRTPRYSSVVVSTPRIRRHRPVNRRTNTLTE